MKTLAGAIAGLRDALGSLAQQEGMRLYVDPPEGINEFPAGMVYAGEGEMGGVSAGWRQSFHTLMLDIYEARAILPGAVDRTKRWPDGVMNALRADETLGESVSGIRWPMRYRAGPMRYGNAVYYGVRLWVTVKINEAG